MPVMMENCDSPIEEEFLQAYHKVAAEGVSVRSQFQGSTALGGFRLDFAIFGPKGEKAGIECDGREYHDLAKDARRDEAIVKSGAVDVIYRLTGSDIYWRVHDLLDLLATAEPWMFSEKGLEVVRGQAAQPHTREDVWGYMSDTMQGGASRTIEPPEYEAEDEENSEFHGMVSLRWTPLKGRRQVR